MKLRIACLTIAVASASFAAPVLATQDGESGTATVGEGEVAPLPSIVPNITETRRLAPSLPQRTGTGRRVVYSNSLQWVWVIDEGEQMIRSMPVSGKRGVPNPGTYRVTSQSLSSYSPDFKGVTFRWMTRFAKGPEGGNIGFHEIPRKFGKVMQTYAQLGSFAGSGCVRMATEDVKFIYEWAKPGTTVVVVR
jgi:lipoprotein-anchoring transpeptidase ErfK/SrfK